MTHIEVKSKVGPNGVLTLSIPVGLAEANREVKVTVEPCGSDRGVAFNARDEWRRFIEETAGSIADPTFERYEQGEFEERGELFP